MGQFIVIQECANGNESVGTEWVETGSFTEETTLAEVWRFAMRHNRAQGRTMIRPDENDPPDDAVKF